METKLIEGHYWVRQFVETDMVPMWYDGFRFWRNGRAVWDDEVQGIGSRIPDSKELRTVTELLYAILGRATANTSRGPSFEDLARQALTILVPVKEPT